MPRVSRKPKSPRKPPTPWVAPQPGLLLSVKECSALLGRSPWVVTMWTRDGTLPPNAIRRIGRRVFFVRRAIEAWVVGNGQPQAAGQAS